MPSEIDVIAVLCAAGCLLSRGNEACTPDRSSCGKRLVEVWKNNNVVEFSERIGDDMGTGKCISSQGQGNREGQTVYQSNESIDFRGGYTESGAEHRFALL